MAYTVTAVQDVPLFTNSTLARAILEFFEANPEAATVQTDASRIGTKARAALLASGIEARTINGKVYARRVA